MINHNIELEIKDIAFNRIDFSRIFPGNEKIELEMGFCSGFFLSEYANSKPDTGFLGLEISKKFFARGENNLKKRLAQDNVRIICFEGIAVIKELIPFHSLDAIHIYFPDPWPKKKHHKFRTVRFENLIMMHNRLKTGGKIYIATDHPEYAEFIKKEVALTKEFFKPLPYGMDDRKIKTKWEKKQIADCWPINYFLLEKL
ncbi:MAG TPA: hypothetical protein PKG52_03365 [bacterium]|nr:hypothetical protein [bacterium]HPS29659.1 hypothetical protein [bacterium]